MQQDLEPGFEIRRARKEDVPLILFFIRRLGEYERLSHEVVASEEDLEKYLFGKEKVAEVLIGYEGARREELRLEWAVLDWNEPSIGFYKSLGARLMDEWIVNRLTGEKLRKLASMY